MSIELSPAGRRNLEALAIELQTLSKRLRFAVEAFKRSPENDRRAAVRMAVNASSEFVGNVFSLDQDLRLPLNQLLYGLADLDNGQVVPFLKPAKVRHRARRSLTTGHLRAAGAALMDIYQQGCMARESAAARAAAKLSGAGYRDEKGKRITGKNVVRWRDDLKARHRKNADDVRRYNTILSLFKLEKPSDAETVALSLLDALPDLVAPSIPRNPPLLVGIPVAQIAPIDQRSNLNASTPP